MDLFELSKRFTYHPPTGDQIKRYEKLREAALQFGMLILDLTPVSREQSLAFTALEECIFHANAAIARNEGEAGIRTDATLHRLLEQRRAAKEGQRGQKIDLASQGQATGENYPPENDHP